MAPPKARWVAAHTGKRDAKGRLERFADAPAHFRPNLTPAQMLRLGMHGGIYFNPKGGKPGIKYPRNKYPKGIPGVTIDEFPREWFDGVPKELYLSRKYSVLRNRYRVKSGLDQAGWESSGWIRDCDPRGWTQWYFRFFLGRRLDDGEDDRQISRWNGIAGEKGRWKHNLVGKCMRSGKAFDDESISPVVRQTLLHWAYQISEADFDKGAKRVRTHGAAYVPRTQLTNVMASKKGAGKRSAAADADAGAGGSNKTEKETEAGGESQRAKRARLRAEKS